MGMINFNKYDKDNPHIWAMFQKLAFEAMYDKGFKKWSANGIFEVMRWKSQVRGNDAFKINNIYRPDYARKMMKVHPEFKGFFEVRDTKAKRVFDREQGVE